MEALIPMEEWQMKCKGKIKRGERKGDPCKKNAVAGRDYCLSHGGALPVGPAHPKFNGRSRYFPTRLWEKYGEALNDPELTQHRATIAMLEARADEVLKAGESELLWGKTSEAFEKFTEALRAKNDEAIQSGLSALHGLITRGHADALRWHEWRSLTDQAEKTKEKENRRLVQMEQLQSVETLVEQMLAFVGVVVDVATRTIKDRDVLREFTDQLGAVLPRQGRDGGVQSPPTEH